MTSSTRHRSAPRRFVLLSLVVLTVAIFAAVALFGRLWLQRPPFINNNAYESGDSVVLQLWGDCCQDKPEHVRAAYAESPISADRISAEVSFYEWLDGTRAWVDGDTASFEYGLSRSYLPSKSSQDLELLEMHECTASDLRAGDSITNGPVTIEVLAVHDMPLNRNNAIDLRITFDPDGIDDEPFDDCG